ncbi:MAG: ribonuclease Z [Nanoarchaeota archaeon]|nr:ribonuclease Z [Nanoarchaeota archaeon]
MTVKLTFLGTADQIPSANRNHSALLLTYEGENILVDCGEGTQRQFRKAKINPCKVTRILITHWHGDHVLGLPGLLSTLALSGYNKTLYIYGPKGTEEFVKELLKVFGFKKKYEIKVEEVDGKFYETKDFYLEAEKMEHGIPCNAYNFVKKGTKRIDKKKLKKYKLKHGPHMANLKQGKDIVYEGKRYTAKDLVYNENGKKISFVFDTLDNKRIISFVKDADLFVCESSFDDELKDHAKEHLHMTNVQAAEKAKKANVKKLVLTHLSMRYEKDPKIILNKAKKVFKNTVLARDFDVFSV